jgi:hypothetical protein
VASFDSPRTLGFVLIAWGVLGMLSVIGLLALLSAPWFEGDSWELPTATSPAAVLATIGLAGSAVSLLAGIGLARSARWGRPLGLVASVVSLPTVPIGTAIGIYGLIVLLGSKRRAA